MEPFAVSIKRFLGQFWVHGDVIMWRQNALDVAPGLSFMFDEFDIEYKASMA